jgi:hypothetical protein
MDYFTLSPIHEFTKRKPELGIGYFLPQLRALRQRLLKINV